MTQAELAGDQITRNMLSLIENGSALPSLPTVIYIADRLNVPVGMLLADEAEELAYKKMAMLPKIKQLYANGEYRLCRDMCRSLAEEQLDDEIYLILSNCYFELGREFFNLGKLHKSARYFDKACEYCKKTIYAEERILSSVSIYFDYMTRLSPSLGSEAENDFCSWTFLCTDSFCRYAIGIRAFDEGKNDLAMECLSSLEKSEDCFVEHLTARCEMQNGEYASARQRLKKLINGDIECYVVMYDIFKDLEECCRLTDDYKGAYEYSVGKIELLERMLREDRM
jgi:transcriptional regulator with XRE-family HTH domain